MEIGIVIMGDFNFVLKARYLVEGCAAGILSDQSISDSTGALTDAINLYAETTTRKYSHESGNRLSGSTGLSTAQSDN